MPARRGRLQLLPRRSRVSAWDSRRTDSTNPRKHRPCHGLRFAAARAADSRGSLARWTGLPPGAAPVRETRSDGEKDRAMTTIRNQRRNHATAATVILQREEVAALRWTTETQTTQHPTLFPHRPRKNLREALSSAESKMPPGCLGSENYELLGYLRCLRRVIPLQKSCETMSLTGMMRRLTYVKNCDGTLWWIAEWVRECITHV